MTVFAVAGLLLGPAAAQEMPVYEATGTVAFMLGADSHQHYTTWNTVPNEPGREIHTASWQVLKPMLLGGVNIAPNDVFVVVSAHPTVNPQAGQAEIRLEFSLDPETLQHRSSVPFTVRYEPKSGAAPLTWEDINVLSMQTERVDDDTIQLHAEIEGIGSGNGVEGFTAVLDLQTIKKR
ncbi:hypothetical protein [Devosia sp. A369]